ncbi:MAG: hypothetical protein EBT92_06480 [Planctomycetes bacterium]|nr:hypothetical protein [Planctomycetota bacterium]NBY02519.1 hypothetical protein [Planctomycetota bacterium]
MSVATPDWVARHDAKLVASENGKSWMLYFGNELTYLISLIPSKGKFGVKVMQTINGKQLPCDKIFDGPDEACLGGLEVFRAKVGW